MADEQQPMSAERWQDMLEHHRVYGGVRLGELIAEVERLRKALAEAERDRDYFDETSTYNIEIAQEQAAKANAMLNIVQAVARCTDNGYGACVVCGFDVHVSRWYPDKVDETHSETCPAAMAEAFLAAYPKESDSE